MPHADTEPTSAGVSFPVPVGVGRSAGMALEAAVIALWFQSVLVVAFSSQPFWHTTWVMASVLMGPEVLAWPPVFDLVAITAAMLVIFPIALVAVLVLDALNDFVPPRMIWLLGLGIGLVFYFVDVYGIAQLFPVLALERNWMSLLAHLLFGWVAAEFLKRAATSDPDWPSVPGS